MFSNVLHCQQQAYSFSHPTPFASLSVDSGRCTTQRTRRHHEKISLADVKVLPCIENAGKYPSQQVCFAYGSTSALPYQSQQGAPDPVPNTILTSVSSINHQVPDSELPLNASSQNEALSNGSVRQGRPPMFSSQVLARRKRNSQQPVDTGWLPDWQSTSTDSVDNGHEQEAEVIEASHTSMSAEHVPSRAVSESERHMTLQLNSCMSLLDVGNVLVQYASQQGALTADNMQHTQSLQGFHDIPEPSILLQSLNSRHLVVLWSNLARILGAVQEGGAVRPHPSMMKSSQDNTVTVSQSGLSRAETVALNALIVKLEQLSFRAMSSQLLYPDEAVTVLWSMAKLQHKPHDRWIPAWQSYTLKSVETFSAKLLSNVLWALATLDLLPSKSWLQAATQRAIQLQTDADSQLAPEGYAVMLWSIARLAVREYQAVKASSWHGETPRLSFNHSQLVTCLEAALRQSHRLEGRHVSMIVWSLGHLAQHRHPCMQALFSTPSTAQHGQRKRHRRRSHAVTQTSSQTAQHDQLSAVHTSELGFVVCKLLSLVETLGCEALGPQGTANVLWACVHLGFTAVSTELESVTTSGIISQDTLPKSSARSQHTQHDRSVCWRLPAMSSVHQLAAGSVSIMPHMSAQQIYNTAWAVASMQVNPSSDWVSTLSASCRAKLSDFEPQSLSGLLWSCCKIGIRPGPAWMAATMRAVENVASDFDERSFPLLLWSLADLGYAPSLAWVKGLTARTAHVAGRMSPDALAVSVQSLAKLQLPAHPAWCSAFVTAVQAHVSHASQNTRQYGKTSRHPAQVSQQLQANPGADVASSISDPQHDTGARVLSKHVPIQPSELSGCLQGMLKLGMKATDNLLEQAEGLYYTWIRYSSQQQQLDSHNSSDTPSPPVSDSPGPRFELSLRDLSSGVYSLVKLGHFCDVGFLSRCAQHCVRQSHASRRQAASDPDHSDSLSSVALDTVQCCWALAMMNYVPGQSQCKSLLDALHPLLPYMGHAELAQAAWSAQKLSGEPPNNIFVGQLLVCAERQLRQACVHTAAVQSSISGSFDQHGSVQTAASPSHTNINTSLFLSTTTILRTLAHWDVSVDLQQSGPSSAHVNGNGTGSVHIRREFLQLASMIVEAAARQQVSTAEGHLPSAYQLSASAEETHAWRDTPSELHEHTMSSTLSSLQYEAQGYAAMQQQPQQVQASAPTRSLSVSQMRLSALSESEVTVGRKKARQRLWSAYRLQVLQHHRLVVESRKALRKLQGLPSYPEPASTGLAQIDLMQLSNGVHQPSESVEQRGAVESDVMRDQFPAVGGEPNQQLLKRPSSPLHVVQEAAGRKADTNGSNISGLHVDSDATQHASFQFDTVAHAHS